MIKPSICLSTYLKICLPIYLLLKQKNIYIIGLRFDLKTQGSHPGSLQCDRQETVIRVCVCVCVIYLISCTAEDLNENPALWERNVFQFIIFSCLAFYMSNII